MFNRYAGFINNGFFNMLIEAEAYSDRDLVEFLMGCGQ